MSRTKFHEQGQEDPQRDLKRLPDVVKVEGEDGESLLVMSGVSLMMGVLICHRVCFSPRLVGSRMIRGGSRNPEEQQNKGEACQTTSAAPPQHSHFLTVGRGSSCCAALDLMKMKMRIGREPARYGEARTFTHDLSGYIEITHSCKKLILKTYGANSCDRWLGGGLK